jgi:hypothetical protein
MQALVYKRRGNNELETKLANNRTMQRDGRKELATKQWCKYAMRHKRGAE